MVKTAFLINFCGERIFFDVGCGIRKISKYVIFYDFPRRVERHDTFLFFDDKIVVVGDFSETTAFPDHIADSLSFFVIEVDKEVRRLEIHDADDAVHGEHRSRIMDGQALG